MFPSRFFPASYFAPRYFPRPSAVTPPVVVVQTGGQDYVRRQLPIMEDGDDELFMLLLTEILLSE